MTSSILTNASAMTALRVLNSINKDLSTTQNRISTGLKVSSAKDNASFWAVSTTMRSDVNSFKAISDNLSLAENSLTVARSGAEQISKLVDTIKSKTTAAQEGSISKEKLQADIDAALEQIEEITKTANFNGVKLLEDTSKVRLLSSIGRDGGDVDASYISFTAQDLSFRPRGGLESIAGLSVLDRGDSLVENKTDGVSVYDIGGIDSRRVRVTFDDVTFSASSADNDFNLTYVDVDGNAQTMAIDDLPSDADMNDLATAIMAQSTGTQAVVDSVSWDQDRGLTINMAHGNEFTDFQEDGTGVAINNSAVYTADKGQQLTFKYIDEQNVERTLTHTIEKDIPANADGAQALVEELRLDAKFTKLFTIDYDATSESFKLSNVSRDTPVTLSGWSGPAIEKQSEAVRFTTAVSDTADASVNITLDTASADNDFQITYLDADGVQKTAVIADATSDWGDTSADGFLDKFNTAMNGVATASYSSTGGLTMTFENGASYVGIANTTDAAFVDDPKPAQRGTSVPQTNELVFQDTPMRMGEELTFSYDINGLKKEVVFKVTGSDTDTGKRIDDETNPNRIVIALDARQVTHESTTGEKIAAELVKALQAGDVPESFGLVPNTDASSPPQMNQSIAYAIVDNKLTLSSAGGFDNIHTTGLPVTDYDQLLDNIEEAMRVATDAAAALGSAQGRIEIQKDFITELVDSLTEGIGTLVDANMNEESARLQALQVQQQLGIQSLSIANQSPQALLSLFQ